MISFINNFQFDFVCFLKVEFNLILKHFIHTGYVTLVNLKLGDVLFKVKNPTFTSNK